MGWQRLLGCQEAHETCQGGSEMQTQWSLQVLANKLKCLKLQS